jgi:predicted lipid carrier protein YhbT
MDFRHFVHEADRRADADQAPSLLEIDEEGAQIAERRNRAKGHRFSCRERSRRALTTVKALYRAVWSKGAMSSMYAIPRFPPAGAAALRLAPLTPLSFCAARLAASLGRRHPALFARLGEQADKVFLIDPTDLPLAFLLSPRPEAPMLEAVRREAAGRWDARVAGPLAALVGLVHGAYDGDALFFARDLVIEGDTEAVVALRNAIDNEEIDLAREAAALFGPLEAVAIRPAHGLAALAARWTGVALTRPEQGGRE